MEKRPLNNNRSVAAVLIASAVILSALAIVMVTSLKSWVPVSLTKLPDPQEPVKSCLAAIEEGRFSECDPYLADFTIADMEGEPHTKQGHIMMELLLESYSWRLVGESEISGVMARQQVEMTYLDLTLFGESVKAQANLIAEDLNYQGIDIFTEEAAMEIADQAINDVKADIADFYVTETITLELEYANGEWKVLYSEELKNIIMGNSL